MCRKIYHYPHKGIEVWDRVVARRWRGSIGSFPQQIYLSLLAKQGVVTLLLEVMSSKGSPSQGLAIHHEKTTVEEMTTTQIMEIMDVVQLAHPAIATCPVHPACLVQLSKIAQKGLAVLKAIEGQEAPQDHQGYLEAEDLLETEDLWNHQDHLDHENLLEILEEVEEDLPQIRFMVTILLQSNLNLG